jgi:putative transposase
LKQAETGLATAELCRQHGINEQTVYRWKAKYGGLESAMPRTETTGGRKPEAEARGGRADPGQPGLELKDLLSKNW